MDDSNQLKNGEDRVWNNACTRDGSVDRHGKPAIKEKTGGWRCGMLLLGNFPPHEHH